MKPILLQAVNHPTRPKGQVYEAVGREFLEDYLLRRSVISEAMEMSATDDVATARPRRRRKGSA